MPIREADPAAHANEIQVPAERRREPRVMLPFAAAVRGTDSEGQIFYEAAHLQNVSQYGLYIELSQPIPTNSELSFTIRLSPASLQGGHVEYIELRGRVRRVEPQPDGRFGLAVMFLAAIRWG